MDEAEEVFNVVLPSGDESAEVVHPGEQPFHSPSPAVAPQLASILSLLSATAPVGRDHFYVVLGGKLLVERVRVIGLVADEPGGKLIEEAAGKNVFHKLALGRRSAFDRYGERKTVISGDSDDLRALPTAGRANGEAPFLALAKVASTNASSRFSLPCSCSRRASGLSASSSECTSFSVQRFMRLVLVTSSQDSNLIILVTVSASSMQSAAVRSPPPQPTSTICAGSRNP